MSRRHLAQRYWDAYSATLEPPAGSAARNLARLHRRLHAGEDVDDGPALDVDRPRRAAAGGAALLGKSAAISVGIATATLLSIKLAVVGWTQLSAGTPASDEPTVERSITETRAPAAAPERAEDPPATAPEPGATTDRTAPAPEPMPRPSEPSRRERASSVTDALRAEIALMDRARAALEQGDAEALSRLTSEHARRFPGGALVEEREAWQAIAACRLGRPKAADGAGRFLRTHPRSAQADKVRRACEPAPESR